MTDKPEFLDNGTAPEFFANYVHRIERMGSVCRIIFVSVRSTVGGLMSEPVFTVVVPTDQLPDIDAGDRGRQANGPPHA